jgi:imidazolonepropionase-like amidohydrolase
VLSNDNLATAEAEYLDPQTREAFRNRGRVKWLSNFTEADFERATRANKNQAALMRAMHEAGVPLLAGTDSNSFGFSLHRELEALVEVGLTPAQALQTATVNPARFAGIDKETGRVATGYAADLILLDANPLQDIRNTSRIDAVILRGQLLDRGALDAMLAKVKERYSSSKP